MNALEQIVHAVLYEGHILYPYRPSSKKNQRQRFTFGRVYPEAYSRAQDGAEPALIQTECLVAAAPDSRATLNIQLRFLHPLARRIGVLPGPLRDISESTDELRIVPELSVGGRIFQTWTEAVEHQVAVEPLSLDVAGPISTITGFAFQKARSFEPICNEQGEAVGAILREEEAGNGEIETIAQRLNAGLYKVTVRVANHTTLNDSELADPEQILLRTFASTHTILQASGAEFVSLIDPGAKHKQAAETCHNIGTWPVLVGEKPQRDTMLSSPIILYDYPEVAAESAGQLFDNTEIDQILTLRILTMTDEEKRQMKNTDVFARQLLERTELLSPQQHLKMHGQMKKTPPVPEIEFDDFFGANTKLESARVEGVEVRVGDRVRIRAKARADALDLVLNGQTAIIEAVEQDLEKRVQLAVVLEKDPGKDLGLMRQPGHRFFYGLDEIEPLAKELA